MPLGQGQPGISCKVLITVSVLKPKKSPKQSVGTGERREKDGIMGNVDVKIVHILFKY